MTADQNAPSLYESPALQAILGPALRPGGLELTRRALSLCGLPAGSRVADIGCGTGVTVSYLTLHGRLRAVGLDRSDGMLDQARLRQRGLPLVKGLAERLPFGNRSLQAVWCECMLSLVEYTDAVWREIQRVLAPGGLLVLADIYDRAPQQAESVPSFPGTGCLKGAKPRDELMRLMHRSGFTLLVWEDHSEALKHLAARLVFACGSLEEFWRTTGQRANGNACSSAMRPARPGYFLAVARKEEGP